MILGVYGIITSCRPSWLRHAQAGASRLVWDGPKQPDGTLALVAGVYADLDFESLKALDPLLRDLPMALAKMGEGTLSDHDDARPHSIPNAFMCSSPQHRFWDFALEHIVEKTAHDAVVSDTNWDHIEQTAGPGMIYATYLTYVEAMNASVPLLPASSIYPYGETELVRTLGLMR